MRHPNAVHQIEARPNIMTTPQMIGLAGGILGALIGLLGAAIGIGGAAVGIYFALKNQKKTQIH